MHILHALFSPAVGGLEEAYVNTTEALASRGHRVSAIMRADAPYLPEVKRYAQAVYTAKPRGFYDFVTAWKVRRLLRRLRPDILIAHNARAIALLSLAAYGTGIPLLGVSHSYKTHRTTRADALVLLTPNMGEHFRASGYPRERMHIIPNFIRIPLAKAPRPRHRPVVIGAIGRFTVEKGFDMFLYALQILEQNGVDFVASIAGDGIEAAYLKRLAEQLGIAARIRWEGWVHDKNAFYSNVDIICIPSLEESFGLVIIEGLAYAIPMVSTDAYGPASILTHGKNALLVPRGDPDMMAAALQQLIEQPELSTALAEAGLTRAADFSFASVAEKWDRVLPSVRA